MCRLLPLAGALLLPLLPVALPAAAAQAKATNVICVHLVDAECSLTLLSIPAAIVAAGANQVDDLIRVGPGTYTDGPYTVTGGAHAVSIQGAGQQSTFLTLPANAVAQTYVKFTEASISDLTITLAAANSSNDLGLRLTSARAARVTVDRVSLSKGKHVLSVRATDASGITDPTPAKARIERVRKSH